MGFILKFKLAHYPMGSNIKVKGLYLYSVTLFIFYEEVPPIYPNYFNYWDAFIWTSSNPTRIWF